jgi:hypothetical protein
MALLLFVRSINDVTPAVEAASEFLEYKQQHLGGSRHSDDLLAIWIDRDLEAALPAWSIPSLYSSSERTIPTPFRLRYSVSLSDIWTLCWIDISLPEGQLGGKSPREALIGTLAKILSARCSSSGPGLLLPVFGANDPTESMEICHANLKAQYSSTIGETWFVHDRNQGKVVPAERADGLRH